MKIALFDPSSSFRKLFIATINDIISDIEWYEFEELNEHSREHLSQNTLDIIVTSAQHKHGDFSAVTRFIKHSQSNQETPIFLFSADSSTAFIDKAFQAGVTDIFAKQDLMTVVDIFKNIIDFTASVTDACILLVEDDKSIAQYYVEELRALGLNILHATNCDEANYIIRRHSVELVITDLNLENGGQGQRVIREIRHNQTVDNSGIPIMVMSSSATAQHRICLFYLGIDEYVVKPISARELSLRAIHLIRKFRAEKEAISSATRFKEIAHYDNVTGGYSRHGFLDVAHFYTAGCKRSGNVLGILYLDLDDFKPVNDTHGHAVGDKVLSLTVKILKSQLREQDVVSRWGGDEFVVLLQDCDKNFLVCVAERIQQEFNEQAPTLFGAGCSIGLSHGSPHTTSSLLELISCADSAMYSSKKTKKGSITVYDVLKRDNVINLQ